MIKNTIGINEEEFKNWLTALRSGEFSQARDRLQGAEGYCCLGVGCVVTVPEEQLQMDGKGQLRGGMPEEDSAIPTWLRLINSDFQSRTDVTLVTLNDRYRWTFIQIADALERCYIKGEKAELREELKGLMK